MFRQITHLIQINEVLSESLNLNLYDHINYIWEKKFTSYYKLRLINIINQQIAKIES